MVIAEPDDPMTKIKILLEYGANVNASNNSGNTPLHLAIVAMVWPTYYFCSMSFYFDILKVLLSAGADKWIRNKDKQTPLEFASGYYNNTDQSGHTQTTLEAVKQLLGL